MRKTRRIDLEVGREGERRRGREVGREEER